MSKPKARYNLDLCRHTDRDYPVSYALRPELVSRFGPVVPLVWVISRISPYVFSVGVVYGFLGASALESILTVVALSTLRVKRPRVEPVPAIDLGQML